MTTLTEGLYTAEFLLTEANGKRSREVVTIAEGENLAAGAVVGIVTEDGEYAAYDNAADTGIEDAAGVLYAAVDATDGAKQGVVIVRDAEVNDSLLQWADDQDSTAQDAGKADLAALGIIARS